MKISKTMMAVALASASQITLAGDHDIEANVTLATDYVWRGVSQTDNKPAIQGGFDYSYDTGWYGIGLYAGTWASNVDATFFGGDNDPQIELDGYLGVNGSIGEFGWDVGWLRYFYPGKNINDTTEWHVGGSWRFLSSTFHYSKDWFATDESSYRVDGAIDYGLPWEIGLSAGVGYNWGDGTKDLFVDTYTDWSIGLSKTMLSVDWSLTYTDTNIDDDDCPARDSDSCDTRFTFAVSKSF